MNAQNCLRILLLPFAENCGADSDECRTFLDRQLKIIAHAHRKFTKMGKMEALFHFFFAAASILNDRRINEAS